MSDVSCRFLGQLARAARMRGIDIEPLCGEVGLPPAHLDDAKRFVPWDTAAAFLTGMQELTGGPAGFRAFSRSLTEPGMLASVVDDIFGLAISPRQLYGIILRWGGPAHFRNVTSSMERRSDGRIEIELRVPEPQTACPALFHGSAGFCEAAPRLLGLGDSVVDARIGPRRGHFVVTPPPSRSVLSRLRRFVTSIRGSKAATAELEAQNEALVEQRRELEAARAALAHSEQRFADIFHASPLPTVIKALDDEWLLDVNARFLETLGLSREEALAKPVAELPVWPSPAHHAETKTRLASHADGDSVDVQFRDGRGRLREGIASHSRSHIGGVPVSLIQVVDVTERREAKRALAESEARLRAIFQAAPDAILLFERDGTCIDAHVSPRALAELGFEDPVGRKLSELGAHSTEMGRAQELNDRICEEGGLGFLELTLRGRGAPRRFEARVARCEPDRVLAIVRDVTERERLEESLRQSQKMEALGQLAGGIAHDFNNILTAIAGFAELQLAEAGPDQEVSRDAEQILAATERASRLTRQLLTFGRRQPVKAQRVDLNEAIHDILEMLSRLIGEDITVRTDLCDEPATVLCDPVDVEQVLMNLALNARDAMASGGTLSLATRAVGDCVELIVEDDGTGMDAAVRRRAFEPFFSTKPKGEASGLGLATVYGIVERCRGTVRLDSEPGRGTRVEIRFGRVAGEAETRDPAGGRSPSGRGETLLIVEDEKALRDLLGVALTSEGYRVLLAADGVDALDMERQHGEPIDALVTDVVMPRMGGVELARQLRERRPGIPALFISGYADQAVPGPWVLPKPFRMPELGRSVREMLDQVTSSA